MAEKTEKNPKIPVHVAIIPDGNRRWAKERGLPTLEGHRRSVLNMEKLYDCAQEMGVKCLTGWAFSTENWKRTVEEKEYLFNLLRDYFTDYRKKFMEKKIRFVHLGRKDRIPEDLASLLRDLEEETKQFTDFTAAVALDYGGHDELERAIKKLEDEGLERTKENIESHLDTAGLPMPELIIRTGGDLRLSGFMSWQCAYAELYFPDMYFPDFGPEELKKAIQNFGKRERRFGGDSKTYGGGNAK